MPPRLISALAELALAGARLLDRIAVEQLPPTAAPAQAQAQATPARQPEPTLEPRPRPTRPADPRPDRQPRAAFDGVPTSGKSLWLWLKSEGEASGVDLVKEMTAWAKRQNLGHKFADMDTEAVAQVYEEAQARLDRVLS